MGESLHIAILNAEEPIENWQCHTFSPLFEELIHRQRQISSSSVAVNMTSYNVIQDHYPDSLKTVDAIMITGSSASVNDEQKGWIQRLQHFIRTVWYFEPQIKMFGACFGHQILCKTILELSVKRLGLEIGAQPITLSPAFIDAFNSVSTARAPNPLRIQLVHEDHVVAPSNGLLPLDCISVGASANCKIQGIYLPQRLLTFQGHAEFNRDICKSTAEAFFAEKFKWDPSLKVECLRDIDQDDDGWWARKAIWDFLTQQTSRHADIY